MLILVPHGASLARDSGEPSLEEYAFTSEWLNLLYFEKTKTGFRSLVTSKAFFMSDEGGHNPLAELKSALKLLRGEDQKTSMNPQCAYPARYEILKRHFKLLEPVDCPQLDVWLTSYEPAGLEIVYTSQFISNPASVFGHAFILVPSDRQVEALWTTFNFAAEIPSDVNPFAYAWGGLTGWYSGDYALMPYYQRLFQYNAIENRDLWRYPIKVTKNELITLMKHFWEVVHLTKFRYYFMDQNCAGYILKSLAAVLPDLSNKSNLPVYVHPVDVIKILNSSGRLGEPTRIPSSFENLRTRFDQFDAEDKAIFFEIIGLKREITPKIKLSVLESVVDYISFERTKNDGELSKDMLALERKAFVLRAQMGSRKPLEVASKRPPHTSHESMRGSLGLSNKNEVGRLDLGYRLAIQDLLEDDAGFLEHSTVEIFSGRLSVSPNENKIKVGLRDLTILKMENYPTFYRFDPKGAWLIHLRVHENQFSMQPTRYQLFGQAAYGGATSLLGGLAFTMLSTELFSNGPQSPFYAGIDAGFLFDLDFGHIVARANLSADPLGRGQNPKLSGRAGLGFPMNQRNSIQLSGERECLYKTNLCRFDFGAEWRGYF